MPAPWTAAGASAFPHPVSPASSRRTSFPAAAEAAGWWLEVGAENWTQAMIEYVPEDEEFTASGSMTLAKDCIGGFTIFALYNSFEDSTGATWIYSRNK